MRYRGDPQTGTLILPEDYVHNPTWMSEHQMWDLEKVKKYVKNKDEDFTFFCGGSRNFSKFIDLLDGVFILDVDMETMNKRIDERVALDPTDFGAKPEEKELILQLFKTKQDIPKKGIIIDANRSLEEVVNEILFHAKDQKISYRETTNEDYEFCEAIHHSGMKPYVEPIWGWDEKFQKERYRRLWIPENIKIILHENKDIGYIEVIETEKQVKLSNIFIIDEYRGIGIGSKVVSDFIDKYKDRTSCLTLNVLWNNPAKSLYERLGFKFIRQEDQILRYELA